MRKSLWIIPLLFAAIGAPNAHAQTWIDGEVVTYLQAEWAGEGLPMGTKIRLPREIRLRQEYARQTFPADGTSGNHGTFHVRNDRSF